MAYGFAVSGFYVVVFCYDRWLELCVYFSYVFYWFVYLRILYFRGNSAILCSGSRKGANMPFLFHR